MDKEKQDEIIKDINLYISDYISESIDEDGYTQYEIGEEEKEFFKNIGKILEILKQKDKIIYEIARCNVKLKGYEIKEEYINNTINFYTKYVENLERNPHWRKESN